ncbi:MAG: ABC transporter permease subunit [Verrucomicrobiota bacterium]|nr:ABC transporter permease subunit [Verrucomicrobiota bacterium]
MTFTDNSFQKKSKSLPRTIEQFSFWAFRLATYLILIAASIIFGKIIYEGGKTVFRSEFPFINVPFLTQAPQTLHVFEYKGEKMEMSDSEFRAWVTAQGIDGSTFKTTSYSYSGGGIMPAIIGTLLLIAGSMTIALVLGIFSAVYLSEYSQDTKFIRLIRLSIVNLAGVPSIVFGLFGFSLFVLIAPIITETPKNDALWVIPLFFGNYVLSFQGWGVSLLAGWFTLAFMVLPIIITASEEALRAVPKGFREGALALGATKWLTIRTAVLPYALPGILTSSVLGISRVAGETAPIMFTAAFAIRDQLPWQVQHWQDFFFQGVMALPYHIYVVSAKIPQNEYTSRMQYGTAFVFLVIVFIIALTSIILRNRARAKYRW